MRLYTAHLHAGRLPCLVREGFSVPALLFGPLWLLVHRAWIPAAIDLALWAVALALPHTAVLWLGLAVAAGLLGQDLRRWSLERAGYVLAHVVAGSDADQAFARLLGARTDLATARLADLRPAGL